jgi:hypothetical protein
MLAKKSVIRYLRIFTFLPEERIQRTRTRRRKKDK